MTRQEWLNVVRDPSAPLSASQRLVGLLIATHADTDTLEAWPSLSALTAESRLQRGTVCRAVDALDRYRLVRRERGGGAKTNHYTLLPPPYWWQG